MKNDFIYHATEIVVAYVSRNKITMEKVPELLRTITHEMMSLSGEATSVKPVPPVSIEDSITDDYLICLEDGKKVTLLRRYLFKQFGLTPEEYIKKWSLPEDYPMVTKSYSKKRSQIALAQGLGKS